MPPLILQFGLYQNGQGVQKIINVFYPPSYDLSQLMWAESHLWCIQLFTAWMFHLLPFLRCQTVFQKHSTTNVFLNSITEFLSHPLLSPQTWLLPFGSVSTSALLPESSETTCPQRNSSDGTFPDHRGPPWCPRVTAPWGTYRTYKTKM